MPMTGAEIIMTGGVGRETAAIVIAEMEDGPSGPWAAKTITMMTRATLPSATTGGGCGRSPTRITSITAGRGVGEVGRAPAPRRATPEAQAIRLSSRGYPAMFRSTRLVALKGNFTQQLGPREVVCVASQERTLLTASFQTRKRHLGLLKIHPDYFPLSL